MESRPYGEAKLASAVIAAAFRDMRATVPTQSTRCPLHEHLGFRVRAAIWLVSKGASTWFDIVGADQRTVLERARWGEVAVKLWAEIVRISDTKLERSGILPQHIRLLRAGMETLRIPIPA